MLVKYAALLAGLLVVVAFGVRPALRHAAVRAQAPAKAARKELPGRRGSLRAAASEASRAGRGGSGTAAKAQEIFEQVTGHLKREPTQSSRLLQSWIHSD